MINAHKDDSPTTIPPREHKLSASRVPMLQINPEAVAYLKKDKVHAKLPVASTSGAGSSAGGAS